MFDWLSERKGSKVWGIGAPLGIKRDAPAPGEADQRERYPFPRKRAIVSSCESRMTVQAVRRVVDELPCVNGEQRWAGRFRLEPSRARS